MSEVKVNKITPTADCGTVTLGDSGDTIAIASGVTLTSAGSITNSGTITNTGTISGGTITGTIDGQVNWQTGSIKTTGFTATAGEGYFCNTTSAAFTVTLPASPTAGDIVAVKDYANTFDTNNLTIGRNGSNIQGTANDFLVSSEGASVTFIYVDATKGWLTTSDSIPADVQVAQYVTATGGTITTCGDYKIHKFTGPGTFCVSCAGNPLGNANVSYMVLAGGGAGGTVAGGGGGGGGFRESKASTDCYSASPLNATSGPTYNLTVTIQGYPITVGGGGAGAGYNALPNAGSNSVFSTITSAGGGYGGSLSHNGPGRNGGSGGGGSYNSGSGGTGNSPPVSPPQGNNGGAGVNGPPAFAGGGGGGAGGVGTAGSLPTGGPGGAAVTTSISATPTTYAAGGGGSGSINNNQPGGSGTPGVSGSGQRNSPNIAATGGAANRGGGGGGRTNNPPAAPGTSGGSGVVFVRYKFQN